MDRTQNFGPPVPVQFRSMVPALQTNQFIPFPQQEFQPAGQYASAMNVGLPQAQSGKFSQPMQQLPLRPGYLELGPPPSRAVPFPNNHPGRAFPLSAQPSNVQAPDIYALGPGGIGAPISSSFSFAPSQYQPVSQTLPPSTQMLVPPLQLIQPHPQIFASAPQMFPQPSHAAGPSIQMQPNIPAGGQPLSRVPAMPLQKNVEQTGQNCCSNYSEKLSTDWIEHINSEGKRYYYNKKAKQSSWEKPLELMGPTERADATTDWREFTSPDGRMYYYNKVTKRSTWTIPEELKLAREQVHKESSETASKSAATSVVNAVSAEAVTTGLVALAPVANAAASQAAVISETAVAPDPSSSATEQADNVQPTLTAVGDAGDGAAAAVITVDDATEPMNISSNSLPNKTFDASAKDMEKGGSAEISEKADNSEQEDKGLEHQPSVYADKLEAKNAFKALLESAKVGSDWTWDRAMRVIINDKRYGALKSLGERKQSFTEYLTQKKKLEAEERHIRLKKAWEEFRKMLEECKELTSSTRWSKAVAMFEDDGRFITIERDRDRRDLYKSYIEELKNNERARAQEERKKNRLEYRILLESCEFIKANTQWRKVQDRLETDERCKCLEKFDRLEIFQEYVNDLEKEEEEQKRVQKEELRKVERRNRDEFRKLMEEHVAAGVIMAETHWCDYCTKVQELPAFQAVASNTSGSTPKGLFDDVAEELHKQYDEDKTRIKGAVKLAKIQLSSTWSAEEFKRAIAVDVGSPPISDINLKLVFNYLLERVRKKEEKEAKKRQRLADDFFDLLCSTKEITSSSNWDECKHFLNCSREYSSMGDENFCMEIFDEYVGKLKEKAKEIDCRRKEKARKEKDREEKDPRKAKQRREKEQEHEKEKHDQSRHVRANDENADKDDLNENLKAHSRNSHRRNSDYKKSKQHASTPESDSGSGHKRHKKDHRSGSRRKGAEDLAD